MSRPHPLHGCGIITPFCILNAWEAQYCSHVEFLQKWVSLTNNQLQGISLLFMLTFIFKIKNISHVLGDGPSLKFVKKNILLIHAKINTNVVNIVHDT